ncbi:MutS-related protein [Olivibacter sitiensis]|uniref:MutS-related protein n=1 Tax=Olivibacter sitiensis TaxID=376470 RepID=UPI000409D69B|nr:hypothetical protein [Olivibacter sitiensis]
MAEIDSAKEIYQKEYDLAAAKVTALDKKINRVSISRLLLIVLAAVVLFNTVQAASPWLTILATILALLSFTYLVSVQSKLEKVRKNWINYKVVRENELGIKNGQDNIYSNGEDDADDHHPYALDLDIFGKQSLYAYVNRCASPEGNEVLSSWMAANSPIDAVRQRQELVRELAQDPSWYRDIQAKLLFQLKDNKSYGKLILDNLSKSIYDLGSKFLRLYVRLAPYIMGVLLILSVYSASFGRGVIWLAVIHLIIAMGYAGRVSKLSQGLSKISDGLQHFSYVFLMIEMKDWQSKLGVKLRKDFVSGNRSVSLAIGELGKLLEKLDYRMNILVATFLNAFFIWDLRQAFALIDWRKAQSMHIQTAFSNFGELEALISLAVLSVNHPSWNFPVLYPVEERILKVGEMKHPLISGDKVVANDYCKDTHQIALITGSNMAGKSTFLRTIGVNIVLAQTGGPVCARSMDVSMWRPVSYMRIKDNLNESTSTFKAELDRLHMILEEVAAHDNVYFLVDEMLRGTNSVDKYLGSKAVIERFIKLGGVGMVATHDLQLSNLEDVFPAYLKNYHFDIQVKHGEMLFDYKLKEGPCRIFNASMLLKRIGIDIDEA